MNVKLLRKVQKHILAIPERIDMDVLCNYVGTEEKGTPPCGTVGCIAGWAHMLTLPEFPKTPEDVDKAEQYDWSEGQEALDLTDEEAERLFTEPKHAYKPEFEEDMADTWPIKFANRYNKASTARGRAKVTSDRIDHFIKTKGRE